MRKKIVAGNWKMNKNWSETQEFMTEIKAFAAENTFACELLIAPSALFVAAMRQALPQHIGVYAQDMSAHISGAFTGEISADMLLSVEATGVILGHSERRQYFAENDEIIAQKVKLALEKGLKPIYCNGENLSQRQAGQHFEVVTAQTQTALFGLTETEIKQVVIAYEPVWAIGTGQTASPEQAQEMHAHIRQIIAQKYGQDTANEISILYGGSVNPGNAEQIFAQPDVDGGLIGGAALKMTDFAQLIKACK